MNAPTTTRNRGLLPIYLVYSCLLAVFWLNTGCSSPQDQNQSPPIVAVNGFSSDSELLSLSICILPDCRSILLNWRTGTYTELKPDGPDEVWMSASFSPDDRYMALTVEKKSDGFRTPQVAIYDRQNKSLRRFTSSALYVMHPTFSPDGKRLIFAAAGRARKQGQTQFADYDVHQIDIATGNEKRLTHFEFYLMGRPHYMPDGKKFLFSAEGPRRLGSQSGLSVYNSYKARYQDNIVFVHSSETKELVPAIINGRYSAKPSVSRDGKISYIAITNEMDGIRGSYNYDIFLDNKPIPVRVTKLNAVVHRQEISPDGRWIAYVAYKWKDRDEKLFVVDTRDRRETYVSLPFESLFQIKH